MLVCQVPGIVASLLESPVSVMSWFLSSYLDNPMLRHSSDRREDELVGRVLPKHGRQRFHDLRSHVDWGSAVCHLSVKQQFRPEGQNSCDAFC